MGTSCVKYPCMTDEEIEAMPMERVFKRGMLFLWSTKTKLEVALRIMRKWGYCYKDFVIWVKVDCEGSLAGAVGRFLDHAIEICLIGVKGNLNELNSPVYQYTNPDVIVAPRPPTQSEKPHEFYELIENIIPNARFVEMFARPPQCLRNGWTASGNEIPAKYSRELLL